jgi:acetyl esterase/lipase
MSTTMTAAPVLEPAAQAFAEATATPPFLLDANELRDAGVPVTAVRYQGIIHDFVMLNALRETQAADAAIRQAIAFLGETLAAR